MTGDDDDEDGDEEEVDDADCYVHHQNLSAEGEAPDERHQHQMIESHHR